MNELQAVAAAAEKAHAQGKPTLLATVVRVQGSAYRRPGARMLLTEDSWLAGSISGGCLEADVLRKAWWRTRSGERTVVTYDSRIEDDEMNADILSWSFGLGCNGVVEILLERILSNAPDCPVAFIADCLRQGCSGVLATVIACDEDSSPIGQRLLWRGGDATSQASTITNGELRAAVERAVSDLLTHSGKSQTVPFTLASGETVDVFFEVVAPPRPLLICGAGHDAVPLARMAKDLGWQVTVVDPRAGVQIRAERFPGADTVLACAPSDLKSRVAIDSRTCAVVMSHNVLIDAAVLTELIPSPVSYIGVLGPRRRTDRLLAEVRDNGVPLTHLERLHAPVGIDIGADTPEAIALSILAEMQAALSGRSAGFLRDRDQPIHDQSTTSPARNAVRESVECAITSA
jgi:xanthine dehydrogenase accessory factor